MSIFISVTDPNTEQGKRTIDEAIVALAANIAGERRAANLPPGPKLDVTFLLPSGQNIPPFTGMRMGGYDGEDNTLFFEAAVPQHMLNSSKASRYVSAVIEDVIDNAGDFFLEHNVCFDKQAWRKSLGALAGGQ